MSVVSTRSLTCAMSGTEASTTSGTEASRTIKSREDLIEAAYSFTDAELEPVRRAMEELVFDKKDEVSVGVPSQFRVIYLIYITEEKAHATDRRGQKFCFAKVGKTDIRVSSTVLKTGEKKVQLIYCEAKPSVKVPRDESPKRTIERAMDK